MIEKSLELKIPRERIGVLIGVNGSVRKRIEELSEAKVEVDSESGEVRLSLKSGGDPSALFKAWNVVLAIARGFSPQRAFKLFEEDVMLEVIDLKELVGKSPSELRRVKGRIIGEGGKTRRIIEEATGAYVSVYGNTVSIIGGAEAFRSARQAIQMLLDGSQHSTVYRFLYRSRRKVERLRERLELWEHAG